MYEFTLSTLKTNGKITAVATAYDDDRGRYYRSEIDIVEPMALLEFPDALRRLGDAMEREIKEDMMTPNV